MTSKWAKGTGGPAGDECQNLVAVRGFFDDATHTLRAEGFDANEDGTGRGTPLVPVGFYAQGGSNDVSAGETSPSLKLGSGGNAGYQIAVAYGIHSDALDRSGEGAGGTAAERAGLGITEDCSPCLNAKRPNAVAAPIPFDTTQITSASNYSQPKAGDPCHPLASGAHPPAVAFGWNKSPAQTMQVRDDVCDPLRASPTSNPAVAFQTRFARNGRGAPDEICPTLQGASAGATSDMRPCVTAGMAVRRLTPRECERLQGFPDDYSLVPYRGKPMADGPRYRALGNSMAVPCMRWIGERIALVEAAIRDSAAPADASPQQSGGGRPAGAGGEGDIHRSTTKCAHPVHIPSRPLPEVVPNGSGADNEGREVQ